MAASKNIMSTLKKRWKTTVTTIFLVIILTKI
jgi:hypothetical protein